MLSGICLCGILSDQFYTWSDEYSHGTRCCTSQTPQCPCTSVAPTPIHPAWFPDRAIQAMRQARMQMCRWSRAWTQILSVGELSGPAAADGLRAPGDLWAGVGVSRQLSTDPRDSGRDLRDQPRVAASSRGALKRLHEQMANYPTWSDRCGSWRRASGQYAGWLARRKPGEFIFCGGRR
jgi:hypothetical protein